MKVTVISPIPTPYRDALWNVVAAHPDVDLSVLYCRADKPDRPWSVNWQQKYSSMVLPGWNFTAARGQDSSCYWNPSITKVLQTRHHAASRLVPRSDSRTALYSETASASRTYASRSAATDAVVAIGYNHPTMWAAQRYCNGAGIPFYLLSESHSRKKTSSWKLAVKEKVVGHFISRCTGTFATGQLAQDYLMRYGAAPDTVATFPNTPDVEFLRQTARKLRADRVKLRSLAGLADLPTVLFAGRLIPKKRAELLIRAFAATYQPGTAQLVIVGDGPERSRLIELTHELGIGDHTHFAGFVQPDEMPAWYAAADLFVLPSSETWGVVVLEALASGLPVVVTDEVGCGPDVVPAAEVGSIVPVGSVDALGAAMSQHLNRANSFAEVQAHWKPTFDRMRHHNVADDFVCHLRQTIDKRNLRAA